MRRRALLGTLGAALTAGCVDAAREYHPLPPLEGRVVERSIRDDGEVLLAHAAEGIDVADPTLERRLSRAEETGNVSVTPELAGRLTDERGPVEYAVTVRHGTANRLDGVEAGEVARYRAGRTAFNRLLVGDRIEFQLGVTDRPRMRHVSRVRREGVVRDLRADGSPDGGWGADAAGNAPAETPDARDEENGDAGDGTDGGSDGDGTDSDSEDESENGGGSGDDGDGPVYRVRAVHDVGDGDPIERRYRTDREVFDRLRTGERFTFMLDGDHSQRIDGASRTDG